MYEYACACAVCRDDVGLDTMMTSRPPTIFTVPLYLVALAVIAATDTVRKEETHQHYNREYEGALRTIQRIHQQLLHATTRVCCCLR